MKEEDRENMTVLVNPNRMLYTYDKFSMSNDLPNGWQRMKWGEYKKLAYTDKKLSSCCYIPFPSFYK